MSILSFSTKFTHAADLRKRGRRLYLGALPHARLHQETYFILSSLVKRIMKLFLWPSLLSTSYFPVCTSSILVQQLGGHG